MIHQLCLGRMQLRMIRRHNKVWVIAQPLNSSVEDVAIDVARESRRPEEERYTPERSQGKAHQQRISAPSTKPVNQTEGSNICERSDRTTGENQAPIFVSTKEWDRQHASGDHKAPAEDQNRRDSPLFHHSRILR